jgi:hypothetical protein
MEEQGGGQTLQLRLYGCLKDLNDELKGVINNTPQEFATSRTKAEHFLLLPLSLGNPRYGQQSTSSYLLSR